MINSIKHCRRQAFAGLLTALLVPCLWPQMILADDAPHVRNIPVPETDRSIHCTVYSPSRVPDGPTGLVIHLYGSGGSHTEFNIRRPPYDSLRSLLSERGYWLIVPELGPKHWMNEEACAVLDVVIADCTSRLNVDPRQIHLLGTSMGAGSSLNYIIRRPGKIRSVAALFPMTDFNRWLQEAPAYRQRVEDAHQIQPDHREASLRNLSPLHHVEAFRTTSVFLLHGAKDDIVPVHHSREFAARLQAQGSPVIYREHPDGTHLDEVARPYQMELADFLTKPAPFKN